MSINKIKLIKAEIEKRKQELRPTNTHKMQVGEMDRDVLMWLNALTWVKNLIDSLEEEPVSNDLEKAATKYARKQLSNPDYPTYNDEYEMECAFEAGAQWQKERDQSTIELAEDHTYLAGQEKIIEKACE